MIPADYALYALYAAAGYGAWRLLRALQNRKFDKRVQEAGEILGKIDAEQFNEDVRRSTQHLRDKFDKLLLYQKQMALFRGKNNIALGQIDAYKKELARLQNSLRNASAIQAGLDASFSAKGRAKLHEECEMHFGTGSPRKAMSEIKRDINQIKRKMEKLEKRLKEAAVGMFLLPKRVIIDGNNISHSASEDGSGHKFVGIEDVASLVHYLAKEAGSEEIIVYFDNSIYGLLERRYGVKVLRDQLESFLKGCGATKVIVARPGEQADEQLLRDGKKSFSAEPCSTVIFSRDKFTDWPEYAEMIERIVIPVWFDGPPMNRTIRSPGLVNMLTLMEDKIPPCEITSVDWTNARQSA